MTPHDFYPTTPTGTLIRWHRALCYKLGELSSTKDWSDTDTEDLVNQQTSLLARGVVTEDIWPTA